MIILKSCFPIQLPDIPAPAPAGGPHTRLLDGDRDRPQLHLRELKHLQRQELQAAATEPPGTLLSSVVSFTALTLDFTPNLTETLDKRSILYFKMLP